MADDEQFSLCWNNFNSNLSAGFHESLCRGDLVDVTLAAEGQFVKAHRLVLSVCSPYFRKMFTQMPANQHAFVFLKDVSHTALKDLIQFMYCGEVNVKQEALPAFISTAEALQIKGLTDSDPPPSQSPAEPSTPTPQIQQISSPRVRQRTSTSRSYKIETVDDSGDDNKPTQILIQTSAPAPAQVTTLVAAPQQHQTTTTAHLQQQAQQSHHQQQHQIVTATIPTTTTVVSHKRPAQRSIGATAPHIKRTKSTIDSLDTSAVEAASAAAVVSSAAQPQQITVQTATVTVSEPKVQSQQQQTQHQETEYIDLPIELPTKSEPDYADDGGADVEGDHEAAYVEDDAYGDLRYDESYFTENEEVANPANTSSATTGNAGTSVATTSKAIIKQQAASFSDSSYVDAGDQGNNDAQVQARTLAEASQPLRIETCGNKKPCEKSNETGKSAAGEKDAQQQNTRQMSPARICQTTKGTIPAEVQKNTPECQASEKISELVKKSEQSFKLQTLTLVDKVISRAQKSVLEDAAKNPKAAAEQDVVLTCSPRPNEPSTKSPHPSKIPLHIGSRVFVSKNVLAKIFIPNACIYTSRLSELVFGVDTLQNAARTKPSERLLMLDGDMLKSIITHVVQVFKMRGENIDETTVKLYIQHKISAMSTSDESQRKSSLSN